MADPLTWDTVYPLAQTALTQWARWYPGDTRLAEALEVGYAYWRGRADTAEMDRAHQALVALEQAQTGLARERWEVARGFVSLSSALLWLVDMQAPWQYKDMLDWARYFLNPARWQPRLGTDEGDP